jgi:hypothetical protein
VCIIFAAFPLGEVTRPGGGDENTFSSIEGGIAPAAAAGRQLALEPRTREWPSRAPDGGRSRAGLPTGGGQGKSGLGWVFNSIVALGPGEIARPGGPLG